MSTFFFLKTFTCKYATLNSVKFISKEFLRAKFIKTQQEANVLPISLLFLHYGENQNLANTAFYSFGLVEPL